MRLFLLLQLLCSSAVFSTEEPLALVIVGGGPVGLSAALEAVNAGASVTVIERRAERSRRQRVFLSEGSIQRLEGWGLTLPTNRVYGGGAYDRIAIIAIHELEALLEKQAQKQGVELLHGTFEGLASDQGVRVQTMDGTVHLEYDLLVGADGAHSAVREAARLPLHCFGEAEGALGWLALPSGTPFSITEPIRTASGYIHRIQTAGATIIFSQGPQQTVEQLIEATQEQGWLQEADLILAGEGGIAGSIPLALQQVERFSAPEQRTVLLGDAAATGSFFQGLGLNIALEEVSLFGTLIRELPVDQEAAYQEFEEQMRLASDTLIRENRLLFEWEASAKK